MRDIIPPKSNYGQIPEDMLRLISYCPVCHFHYNPLEARVLEENDAAHLIYIKCQRCKSAIVALIVSNNAGISSVGLITDLDSQEISKFKDGNIVNESDVLSVYSTLRAGRLEKMIL